MAKKKVIVPTSSKAKVVPTVSKTRKSGASSSAKKAEPLVFHRANYMMMLAGIGLVMFGLILMSGGAMPSPDVWDESIIYSTRRITIGPMVILLGLVVNIMAIFHKPKMQETAQPLADL